MFTGLIEEIGEIIAVEPVGDSLRFTVAGPLVTSDATHGASICVSGVCLTVIELGETDDGRGTFTADVMEQSIRMSTLGELGPGSPVNLERAVRVDTRLGGHIVQGHVDGTATLLSVTPHEAWRTLRFSLAPELAPLLVDKGSVTLSGVSLTVSAIADETDPEPWFEVSLIPETLTATILGRLSPGDRVNVETDILARHVARMLRLGAAAAPAVPTSEGLPA
ncbi:riboflavin synthase [Leucobacter massiliensis]|uniref:Riboflavin synthase n=1 Tax=Leucobacter massiliensis TaxID=1686285 RepID=A0A2S9QSB5_9MICO|nr:riboflavin synthase [Leucobacter massiliensis]PRI12462.1 riboflavin synthase [Leucobacter massiliensis]